MEIKEIKSSQDEIKNAITKLQSRIDVMAARMDEAEKQISDIEDTIMENKEAEKRRETKAKEHNIRIRELSDSLKRNNIQIIGVLEDKKREKQVESSCKQIIMENVPNLGKDTNIKI